MEISILTIFVMNLSRKITFGDKQNQDQIENLNLIILHLSQGIIFLLINLLFVQIKLISMSSKNLEGPRSQRLSQTPRISTQPALEIKKWAQGSLPYLNPEGVPSNDITLRKLIDMNREYLQEKVRVGYVRRPTKYSRKLPFKTGKSEYDSTFSQSLQQKDLTQSTPNRSKISYLMKMPDQSITNYQSTYEMDYAQRQQEVLLKKIQSHKPTRYEKKQGPFFTQTSYHRDYAKQHQSSPSTSIKPEGHLAPGGKFNPHTTYKQHFAEQKASSPPQPIVHKDHSIFTNIIKPKSTSYRQAYQPSAPQLKPQNCRPNNRLIPLVTKLKYPTQYSQKYTEQNQLERGQFDCLNSEELKDYILNILK